jgi:hypothetical protein
MPSTGTVIEIEGPPPVPTDLTPENIPLEIQSNVHNESYLRTKRDKMGHNLNLKP